MKRPGSRGGHPFGAIITDDRPWSGISTSWKERGACVDADPAIFFDDTNPSRHAAAMSETAAKLICRGCPVQVDCLEFAITVGEYGIWGGTTRRERRQIVKLRTQRSTAL